MTAAAVLRNTSLAITPELPSDRAAVEALVLAAFGPGRYAKTAERIREHARMTLGLVAREGDRIVGSVHLWAVKVGEVPAVFLGPITVDADCRKGGLGGDLVAACIEAARQDGVGGVLLVGDPPYFERFGFLPAPDAILPGPVDRRRVMWLPITAPVPTGPVTPVA
ncbi:MAG: N-acetyltransferase [Caulobacteraceae bacterium]|nr:N-acetyltransferase [Caulobacteraceae bacterium]